MPFSTCLELGNQREPQEMSYVSHTGGGSGSGGSKDTAKTDAKDPLLTRCYSAQPEMTPRTRRRFLKSQSVMTEVPLKEGTVKPMANNLFNVV